jgi:hypothetical protein
MKQGVSIVWDKNGKFFQVWTFDYKGDGKSHAETIANQIGGSFEHNEPKDYFEDLKQKDFDIR